MGEELLEEGEAAAIFLLVKEGEDDSEEDTVRGDTGLDPSSS